MLAAGITVPERDLELLRSRSRAPRLMLSVMAIALCALSQGLLVSGGAIEWHYEALHRIQRLREILINQSHESTEPRSILPAGAKRSSAQGKPHGRIRSTLCASAHASRSSQIIRVAAR